jgi:hypothetical protein
MSLFAEDCSPFRFDRDVEAPAIHEQLPAAAGSQEADPRPGRALDEDGLVRARPLELGL